MHGEKIPRKYRRRVSTSCSTAIVKGLPSYSVDRKGILVGSTFVPLLELAPDAKLRVALKDAGILK